MSYTKPILAAEEILITRKYLAPLPRTLEETREWKVTIEEPSLKITFKGLPIDGAEKKVTYPVEIPWFMRKIIVEISQAERILVKTKEATLSAVEEKYGKRKQMRRKSEEAVINLIFSEVIRIRFLRELEDLEKDISKRNYEDIEEYPTEINELIKRGNEVYGLKGYNRRVRVELLTKVVKILQEYLERGGKLKREDVRNYVSWIIECMRENPKILMELDLSSLLPSFGYTIKKVHTLNDLINQYIVERIRMEVKKEPSKELRDYLRNEFLLISLLWV
jgi:molybdopterin converting factor small subunit